MREIKFRAWNKEKKIMCYDNEDDSAFFWDGAYCSTLGMINYRINENVINEYEFMQYTGLKDKNGKEIYEGDILRLTWHDNYDCANYEYTGKVFFREDTCMFLVSNGKSTDYDWWHEEKEVIGNIYENPELLEREV